MVGEDYCMVAGMTYPEAYKQVIWFDILTEEFILHLSDYYFKDINLSDVSLNKYFCALFSSRIWLNLNQGSYENNGRYLEWEREGDSMKFIRISNVLGDTKHLLLELTHDKI
jgi:hypothetical protein